LRIFYWNKKQNFGDLLGPLLLEKFSRISTTWSEAKDSEIVSTGSIIGLLPSDYTGIIAGSGKLKEESQVPKNAKVLGLRGPLSAKGIQGNFILGDPGLLADELIDRPDKEYELGIVAHWTDDKLIHDPRFTRYNPKIIRVSDEPLEVIRQIGQCKKIISSSLHGIILADAFGISRRIELAPKQLTPQEGGLFKWRDYHASIGMKLEIGITKQPSPLLVSERQHELYDMFKELRRYK
jgi:pyruvyltransferase